jgi:hypothetical protein
MKERVKQPGAPYGKLFYELADTAGGTVTLAIREEIGRAAVRTQISNDSAEDVTVEVSHNGTEFSDGILLMAGEDLVLDPLVVEVVRITQNDINDAQLRVIAY